MDGGGLKFHHENLDINTSQNHAQFPFQWNGLYKAGRMMIPKFTHNILNFYCKLKIYNSCNHICDL